MPPLRKRESKKQAEMMEINIRTTPSPDEIEMPTVSHSVYGQYRPVSRDSRNYSRPTTAGYVNPSESTLALNIDSPQTPRDMSSNAHLPAFAPGNGNGYGSSYPPSYGPPSYQPSPAGTRSNSPYPGSRSPFVS